MECVLTDCTRWTEEYHGCRGSYWPLNGGTHERPVDVSHKCCGYRSQTVLDALPDETNWFWPEREDMLHRCLAPEGRRTLERADAAGRLFYVYDKDIPGEVREHLERLTRWQAARRGRYEGRRAACLSCGGDGVIEERDLVRYAGGGLVLGPCPDCKGADPHAIQDMWESRIQTKEPAE